MPAGTARGLSLPRTTGHTLRWSVPYRVDLRNVGDDALDRLVELGAIDAECLQDGGIAALMPDSVAPEQVASALGVDNISVSRAAGRDAGSVWVLSPRRICIGRLRIVPVHTEAEPDALRLADAAAFGTGLHPTTALLSKRSRKPRRSRLPTLCSTWRQGPACLRLLR